MLHAGYRQAVFTEVPLAGRKMRMREPGTLSFTLEGEKNLFEIAESFSLEQLDARELLFMLKDRMRAVPFGDPGRCAPDDDPSRRSQHRSFGDHEPELYPRG